MIATMKLAHRGRQGTVKVNGDAYAATAYLPDKLWRLYLADPDTIGAVFANDIRQRMGWPRGEANHTIIAFRKG